MMITYIRAVTVVGTAGLALLLLAKDWLSLLRGRLGILSGLGFRARICILQIFIDFLADLGRSVFTAGDQCGNWSFWLLVHLWQIV